MRGAKGEEKLQQLHYLHAMSIALLPLSSRSEHADGLAAGELAVRGWCRANARMRTLKGCIREETALKQLFCPACSAPCEYSDVHMLIKQRTKNGRRRRGRLGKRVTLHCPLCHSISPLPLKVQKVKRQKRVHIPGKSSNNSTITPLTSISKKSVSKQNIITTSKVQKQPQIPSSTQSTQNTQKGKENKKKNNNNNKPVPAKQLARLPILRQHPSTATPTTLQTPTKRPPPGRPGDRGMPLSFETLLKQL